MKKTLFILLLCGCLWSCQKEEFVLGESPWDQDSENVIVSIDSITENPFPGSARIHYSIDESYLPESVTWGFTYGFKNGAELPFYTVTSFRYIVDPDAVSGETNSYEMLFQVFPETFTRRFGPFEVTIP